ncbi:hypothetical protein BAUCODRAFT_203906 [Baudoinia panamericana UAMH 10762]|uniref:Uncharacterized protein n=1 Tax=Baudoinia panamericana (strain UAMH 10762) TaxID=717646 RepID=M2NQC5_BAUPA|nr:uncharacterized protein BAUCODRAFT_203906 [Baudoinia panamericana UAMH 10762]EMD01246.1 hypothetical protein BAUCODRAFT_203906 [Baudoinia panamericana UAMH 10762]
MLYRRQWLPLRELKTILSVTNTEQCGISSAISTTSSQSDAGSHADVERAQDATPEHTTVADTSTDPPAVTPPRTIRATEETVDLLSVCSQSMVASTHQATSDDLLTREKATMTMLEAVERGMLRRLKWGYQLLADVGEGSEMAERQVDNE